MKPTMLLNTAENYLFPRQVHIYFHVLYMHAIYT